jgi:pyruvate dehydrogenase E2 component (dihydrolipoamide acetyltransferase)
MDIKLPQLGEGADSGTVVQIHVREGDHVEKDQTLIELENEKAVAPIPSTRAGKVTKLHVKEGDELSVGDLIISLSEEETSPDVEEEKNEESADAEAQNKKESARPERQKTERAAPGDHGQAIRASLSPPASPSIRKLARDLGIALTRVRGSERGGRIVQEDLRAYIERLQQIAFQIETKEDLRQGRVNFSEWGSIYKRPVSSLRQAISRKMSDSWETVPHVTQFDEADASTVSYLKAKYEAAYREKGARLTLTPLVIKALIPVLREFPIFNASLETGGKEIVFKEYYHIGVAVETTHGLMVPVVREADQKSLLDLAVELESLTQKAKTRKLPAGEMKGGTFTISNQGAIGGAHFTPIVNIPEVAILGIGRGKTKPVVTDNGIEPRMMMPLCLSYDHRIIDGGSAARFITMLVDQIEKFSEEAVKLQHGSDAN